ncbi:vWA domain-containing protein [Marinibactrum halimedae]|uniref:VWA domain-containing protein n=1 Tax=Marinibactrum halimedae TaxID=1444977 RepID=A0AA37WN53_9GAMM|nr:VWA domain-containing protein [Marinibactrum halimedae]MCD9458692.1 VWA domain-containing protein [Marinibactrum halimedae]GLS25941.1 VWA domain-containing protein [Marinibactrum halimedae]
MLINFFYGLKNSDIPVSLKEYLVLLEALEKGLAFASVDDFYLLSRTCLIKDEKYFDKFDRAFGAYFKDIEGLDDVIEALIPDDWIRSEFIKQLTEEEKKKIDSLGGLDELIKQFKERLEEQKGRHQGGNRWIGTGGTSPFGNSGYNPEGIRVGGESRNKSAVKVWDKREFKNLDDSVELGTRNIKVALRKLRKFARTGSNEELDLDDTIRSTASNAGLLDLKMVRERHNAVKVLLFFDVGGSMDPYVEVCEELFSACKTEFKHMEYFYFHNFIYQTVWKDNARRMTETTELFDIMHTYSRDYKIIFVGDASMAPYEVVSQYGSVEFMNEEPGATWMKRLTRTFENVVWLNPVQEQYWDYTQSIQMIKQLVEDRMFPLTLDGLDRAIKSLLR